MAIPHNEVTRRMAEEAMKALFDGKLTINGARAANRASGHVHRVLVDGEPGWGFSGSDGRMVRWHRQDEQGSIRNTG